jgi:ankyrin repeat protein
MSGEMESACCKGDIAEIVSLIEAGESPNSVDAHGYTPVMIAIFYERVSAAKVLFGFWGDLSIVDDSGGNLLHIAAQEGSSEAIKWLLINNTIGINSTDNEGMTAVHFAVCSGSLNSAILLFESGASLSMVNNDGKNLLHYAANDGNDKAINWVLENSTLGINSADSHGNTPMTLALKWGRLASATLLVERGANLFLKDDEGTRAIDVRVNDRPDGEPLGPQVLLHAKQLRWAAVKEFALLATACQSPTHGQMANTPTIYDDDATILSRFRSVRLAASIFAIPGLLRLVGSYIIRSEIIVRDKAIPKPPDGVKLRVEAALKAAAGRSSSKGNSSSKGSSNSKNCGRSRH